MYEARIKADREPGPSETESISAGGDTKNQDGIYEAYAVSADAILSTSQAELFRPYLRDYRVAM